MDSFTVQWVNRYEQFDSVDMDLIVVHDQGEIDDQRIPKSFRMSADLVDSDFLTDIAEDAIGRIVAEYEAQNI